MKNHHNYRSMPKKCDEDLRNDGITLIRNALKARMISEPLLDSFRSGTAEKSDINWACYMMAQSTELFIKGLVSYYFEYYKEGHFVGNNAKTLESLSDVYVELREISDVISKLQTGIAIALCRWSAIGRYKDLHVTKSDIELADFILDDLSAFVRRHHFNEEL